MMVKDAIVAARYSSPPYFVEGGDFRVTLKTSCKSIKPFAIAIEISIQSSKNNVWLSTVDSHTLFL
jgi:hypothetical protein